MKKIAIAFALLAISSANLFGQGESHIDLVRTNGDFLYTYWSHLPYFAETEFAIYDITSPLNPSRVGVIPDSIHAEKLVCGNDRVFIPGIPSDLFIVDISNPQEPYIIGRYDGEWYRGRDIIELDTLAILLWSTCDYETALGGIDILNIADQSAPTRLLRFNIPTQDCGLAMAQSGNYLYIVGGDAFNFRTGRLTVVDIADLLNPVIVITISLSARTVGIAISGHYAYVIDNYRYNLDNAMKVYDIIDPANPSFTSMVEMTGPRDIFVNGTYAFIAADTSGIWLIDITDPTNPAVVETIDTPGSASSLSASGRFLYLADYDSLRIFESDLLATDDRPVIPEAPPILTCYPNPFNARTTIAYGIPHASDVTIAIFDLVGREVASFNRGYQRPGYYRFTWDAGHQPTGIYFYRVTASEYKQVRKMLLVK